MENDRILRRVKGLLALAEGNSNMEESHSAFLMAQKLMVKYGIEASELTDDESVIQVLESDGTDFKRLYWYERELAHIVAKNFRCKDWIRSRRIEGRSQIQRKIMFMGEEQDVQLATEMYRLVISAIEFYTHRHIKEHGIGIRSHTQSLKNGYMRGFIDGLERKFEEQIQEQEWGLVLVIPKEVKEKYKEVVTGKAIPYTIPSVESRESYRQGYEDGNRIDYKKETIDDEALTSF